MPNPYTFVNWGVIGITDKGDAVGTPRYKVTIWEEEGGKYGDLWSDYRGDLDRSRERGKNKKFLGYATPIEAQVFFNDMVSKIERHNAINPVKRKKIRFLKSLSYEPEWEKIDWNKISSSVGILGYAWYRGSKAHRVWGGVYHRPINHRTFISFAPIFPPKRGEFRTNVEELNYFEYGF